MKHLIILSLAIALIGCKTMQPLTEGQKTIAVVKNAKGKGKDELFDSSRIWIAETFRSAKAVLEYENKEKGVIIGNGTTTYPCNGMSCIAKGNWKLHFSMRIDFKNERYRVSFTNLGVSWPASYSGRILSPAYNGPINNQGDYEEIKAKLMSIAYDLDVAISSESKVKDW